MKASELYKTPCTLFGSATGWCTRDGKSFYVQKEMMLYEIIKESRKLKPAIDLIRSYPYHSEKYDNAKQKMPCYVLGKFNNGVADKDMTMFPNLIAIDIDYKDNPEWEELRSKIFELPYVLATLQSIGGRGFYALVAIKNGELRKQYYKKIAKVWNMKFGINVDGNANSLGRKRFCSYENNMIKWLKKPDEEIKLWDVLPIDSKIEIENNYIVPKVVTQKTENLNEDKEFCELAAKEAMKLLSPELKEYQDWEVLAERLKNFECDMWDDFWSCCAKSPRTNRRGGWKKDLENLKRVFKKEKSSSWKDESLYFFKVLKNEYGVNWVKQVRESGQ